MKLSIQSGALSTTLRAALAATIVVTAACGSDSATGVPAPPAQIRVVNSVFQYTDATSTASKTAPRAIDVLVDSSVSSPGMASIPANSLAALSGANAGGYAPISAGIHSFLARLPGDTSAVATFFTNSVNNLPYTPRQYFTSGTPYTLVVAGIIPVTPAAGAARTLVPATAVPFSVVTNDPFPPPQVNGVYQARFTVVNAAPFTVATGAGSTLIVYLTPTVPTTFTGLTASASAAYRGASQYVNTDAGTYVLTLTVGAGATAKVVAQLATTLAAGEVRTFVVQSKGYAAVPSPANSTILSILDNKY